MNYPKRLMSITELSELGYAKATLRKYARAKGSPIILTAGGGKIYFDTDRLDGFIADYNKQIQREVERRIRVNEIKKSMARC